VFLKEHLWKSGKKRQHGQTHPHDGLGRDCRNTGSKCGQKATLKRGSRGEAF
jgi:hypothetical protein